MLLLITLIEPRANPFFLPAVVQIILGFIGIIAGPVLSRRLISARYVIAIVALGVAANVIFMLSIFVSLAASGKL